MAKPMSLQSEIAERLLPELLAAPDPMAWLGAFQLSLLEAGATATKRGPKPPGPGWVLDRTGPRGGKVWRFAGTDAEKKAAAPIPISAPAEPVHKDHPIPEGDDPKTHTTEFFRFFGDWEADPQHASKVVDDYGKPKKTHHVRTVYHGTDLNFSEFNPPTFGSVVGKGIYFAEDPRIAEYWAKYKKNHGANPHVIKAYLNIRNPFDFDADAKEADIHKLGMLVSDKAQFKNDVQFYRNRPIGKLSNYDLWEAVHNNSDDVNQLLTYIGYDGISHKSKDALGSPTQVTWADNQGDFGRVWIAFDPAQIKSVENKGTFDPKTANIFEDTHPNAGMGTPKPGAVSQPLTSQPMVGGFSGVITDSIGRKYHFVNGKRVPGNEHDAHVGHGGASQAVPHNQPLEPHEAEALATHLHSGGQADKFKSELAPAPAAPGQPVKFVSFKTAKDAEEFASQNIQNGGLDKNELDAVKRYRSTPDVWAINNYLRGKKSLGQRLFGLGGAKGAVMKNLDSCIAKGKIKAPVTVQRGLKLKPEDVGKLDEMFKPGKVFQDNGYVSTTLADDVAEKFSQSIEYGSAQVRMHIDVPAGTHAYAMPRKEGEFDEAEVLLARGSRFVVHSVDKKLNDAGLLQVSVRLGYLNPESGSQLSESLEVLEGDEAEKKADGDRASRFMWGLGDLEDKGSYSGKDVYGNEWLEGDPVKNIKWLNGAPVPQNDAVMESDEPFTGIDSHGHKWVSGHQVKRDDRDKPTETKPAVAATQPRIFKTPDDIEKVEVWGSSEERWGWKKERGVLLTGRPVHRNDLPNTLYHATIAGPAVIKSGMLLGQHSDAGLGGGVEDGVSLTSSKADAELIARELKRAVAIAKGQIGIEDFAKLAREDEQIAGLPEGALSTAIKDPQFAYKINAEQLPKFYGNAWRDHLPSVIHDAYNQYLFARETAAEKHGAKNPDAIKNPILFGNQDKLKQIDPANIQVLEIPKAAIPEKALVTSGSDDFLHEVRVYADVPVKSSKTADVKESGPGANFTGQWTDSLGRHQTYEHGKLVKGQQQADTLPALVTPAQKQQPQQGGVKTKQGWASKAKVKVQGHPAIKPTDKVVRQLTDEEKADAIKRVFGKPLTPQDFATIVGAEDDVQVTVEISGADTDKPEIWVTSDDGYKSERKFAINDDGDLYVFNAEFEVKAGTQKGTGLGTRVFARQVQALRAVGVKYISTYAAGTYLTARSGDYNGYYTWPSLGYDSDDPLPDDDKEKVKSFAPNANTVLDIFAQRDIADKLDKDTADNIRRALAGRDKALGRGSQDHTRLTGADWWYVYGTGGRMHFDLREGSRSSRILDEYVKRKNVKLESRQLREATTLPPSGTGVITDAIGRKEYYVSHKHVAGPEDVKAVAKAAPPGKFKEAAELGKKVLDGAVHLEEKGKDFIVNQVYRLPAPLRLPVVGTFKALYGTYFAANAAVHAHLKALGMSEEEQKRVATVLTNVDAFLGMKVIPYIVGGAVGALTGNPVTGFYAGFATSFIPAASLTYLAFSAGRHPIKTLKHIAEKVKAVLTRRKGQPLREDRLVGGRADDAPDSEFDEEQLKAGIEIEMEHTNDPAIAKEIAKDHLRESPDYYRQLRKMEKRLKVSESLLLESGPGPNYTGPWTDSLGRHQHYVKGKLVAGAGGDSYQAARRKKTDAGKTTAEPATDKPKDEPQPPDDAKTAKLRKKLSGLVKFNATDSEKKQKLQTAFDEALKLLKPKEVQMAAKYLHRIILHDSDNLNEFSESVGNPVQPGVEVLGMTGGEDNELHSDSLTKTPKETLLHEMGHAVDRGAPEKYRPGDIIALMLQGMNISGNSKWVEIWEQEIHQPNFPLSGYATTHPVEGWAEFFRLEHVDPERAKRDFPLSHKYYTEHLT